ncbi:MAG TPA: glycine betaine ABC transporter substrate-binding protein, partial [Spirochaetia bacterium]|nr:glycine betaine ABC transporter substrate-binding protein [Spirochaetia bacterium]
MRNVIRTIAIVLVALVATTTLFAEGGQEAPQEVKLTYVNWEEGVAWTHFLATVLEDEMGYEATLTAADVGPAFSSVAAGDQDFFMEAWLPGLHTVYTEGTDLVEVGRIYEDGVTGLIVPQYMYDDGVTTVSDLADPEVVERLDGQITGIDAGAGMMIKMEEELIPEYNLAEAGLELLPSSGPAMMAALEGAIANEEYIVGMG